MKNKELFDRTISVLVKAYFEGELNYFICASCGVGNLVAAANGYTVGGVFWLHINGKRIHPQWSKVFYDGLIVDINYKRGLKELKSTGYSPTECLAIELAFAQGIDKASYKATDDQNFNGLMSIVDTLQDIHECSEEEKDDAKLMFVK